MSYIFAEKIWAVKVTYTNAGTNKKSISLATD